MQTYLGLDIGTYSIKAVILKVSFESCFIEDMIEQEFTLSADVDEKIAKIQALNSILSALKDKEFESVYASLGCQFTIMKRFDLNNVKRSDRQKIIENEFDLLGIFNLSEYAIEYHTIKFDKNYAKLLSILIHKPSAKQLIDILTHCELNVRIIDVDTTVFLNLVKFLPNIEGSSSRGVELFLDIGHSKTSFMIIENNRVINARFFSIAGMHLTNLIKNKFNIDDKEASNLKHNIHLQNANKDYSKIKSIVENFYEELSSEIKRTIKSINAIEFLKIDRVFITGGSSKFEGVQRIFEKNLEIETINLHLLNKDLIFSAGNKIDFHTFSQAIAVVLRVNLNPSNSKINIRHGELALVSDYEKIITEVAKYAKLAGVFILVLLATYFLRSFLFNYRITEMKTQFKAEVIKMFTTEPKALRLISGKKNWDFNEYSNQAIKLIKENKKNKEEIVSNLSLNNISTPLKILNQISLAIPKNIYFEVVDFKYQEGILLFEADTNNSQSVEEIITRLKNIKDLSQVTKKSEVNKAGSNGKLVHFEITANVAVKGV